MISGPVPRVICTRIISDVHSTFEVEEINSYRVVVMVGEAAASIVLKVIVKIPSEMEVARRYTWFTLFILFKLLYTA